MSSLADITHGSHINSIVGIHGTSNMRGGSRVRDANIRSFKTTQAVWRRLNAGGGNVGRERVGPLNWTKSRTFTLKFVLTL